jgi:TolB protein
MLNVLLLLAAAQIPAASSIEIVPHPKERHFKGLRQLTFGGQNAEAYWSADGKWLTYQSLQPGYPDEQVFIMRADGSAKRLASTGKGRCTCSYFSPDGRWLYFSSTHDKNEGPQPPVDHSRGYVWRVNPQFSLFKLDARALKEGRTALPIPILDKDAYVAETTIAPNARFLTFTSDFEGDLEIYRSDLSGKNIKRLTSFEGYDGGPFISWDSKKIVYRRSSIKSPSELEEYKTLLKEHLVRPSKLEIWIMDADGKNNRQVTSLGAASFAPFLHPDGKRIIFSSNFEDPKGREFDLYLIGVDGSGLERITHTGEFDGFPMFTRDGRRLVFASNRNSRIRGETNLFVADWTG